MAATVLAAAQALPQRGLAENQAKVFWSKEMLHAKPNEAAIRQNTHAAFVPIPDYKPEKLSPCPNIYTASSQELSCLPATNALP